MFLLFFDSEGLAVRSKLSAATSALGSTTSGLRKTWSCPTLLRGVCKVSLHTFMLLVKMIQASFCRYYESDVALLSHRRSKVHKRRCKDLKEPAYTIEESERAGGLGREGKRPEASAPTVMAIG